MQKRTLLDTSATSKSPLLNRIVNKTINEETNQESLAKDELSNVKDNFKKYRLEDDLFDSIGKRVATKLRKLPKRQMLIAEKLINDTLFHSELGNLSSLFPQNYELPVQHFQQILNPFPASSFTHLSYIKHPLLFTSSITHQLPQWYQIRPMYYEYYEDHNITSTCYSFFYNILKLLLLLYKYS